MEQDFDARKDFLKEALRRFERMLKTDVEEFFELEIYEQIVGHYLERADLGKALQACEKGLESYPYALELLLDKANLLAGKDEFDAALEVLERATLFHPADHEIKFIQGTVYNLMGEFELSVSTLKSVLEVSEEKDKDNVYFHIGQAYQNWEKYELAIENYKQAVMVNTENELAFYELAHCLDLIGELGNHLPYYQALVDENPFSYMAWYNVGIAYGKVERYEDAVEAYDYAALLKEDFASAYFNLGNSLMNLSRFQEAAPNYLRTIEIEGLQPETCCCLGACYERMGEIEKAVGYYREAVKLDSQWDDGWFGIGLCMGQLEKWYEAVGFLRKAIQISEFNPDYWLALAEMEYKLGNIVSALEAFEKSVEIEPSNPDVWLKWSMVHFEQGDYSRALDLLQAAIDDMPGEADLYYRSSAYLIHAGNYREALLNLEVALTLDYEGHAQLYDFFPDLEKQKALFRIIEQYRSK